MSDSFSEVTSQSWFGRIGSSIKGIIFGLILFIVAFPVLFWNEGRAVKTYKTLKEGKGQVITVESATVDAANEGKLVHMTGLATTEEILADATFGISENAIKIRRTVEMYQWQEKKSSSKKKRVGGSEKTTTTYNYSKVWSDKLISSSKFKKSSEHKNPSSMPYSENKVSAKTVKVGAFDLSSSLINKVGPYEKMAMDSSKTLPAEIASKGKIHDGSFYIGTDPASPKVGDVRISFQIVKPLEVSLVSQQLGSSFEPFLSKTGKTLEMLSPGTLSTEAMFIQAEKSNATLTLILRVVGFVLMFIGLVMVLRPLSVLADVLPFLGNLVSMATGLVAFLVAGICALVTIAVAWVVYRPLLGVALLIAAGGLAYFLITASKKKAKAKAATA